jgi:ferrochelatase
MSRFKGTSGNPHDGASRVGVLLVNHGSPDGTDVPSVRRYLRTFLSDPRLIELPRILWLVILHGIILRVRPRRTAKAYKKIWTDAGSPMQVISDNLLEMVRQRCQQEWGENIVIAGGSIYGNPSIAAGLEQLRQADAHRIIVVPLYPQYTSVTVGSVFDRVAEEIRGWRWVPELRFVSGYHDLPEYLDAIVGSVKNFWKSNGPADKLIFSYHSLPIAYVNAGDPYFCICSKTTRKLAAQFDMQEGDWLMSFQSTFVGGDWLKPDLDELLGELQQAGHKTIDVICPGFAVDNLETLEEIVERYIPENSAAADAAQEIRFIPCLNDSREHVDVVMALIRNQVQGWEDVLRPVGAVPSIPAELRGEVAARLN